jgi:hypothetical protein
MMVATALDAMVTTRAKVASSKGHSWMRSARFSNGLGGIEQGDLALQHLECGLVAHLR